jgi:hypothetical protein
VSDWQIGDLMLCVDAGPMKIIGGLEEAEDEAIGNLREGRIYRVDRIRTGLTVDCIGLVDLTERAGGVSTRFRKIRPDEHEACEDEFITLLNRSKAPAKVGFDEGVSQ